EIFEGRTGTLRMLDENTLLTTMKPNTVVDLPDALENYEASLLLTKGNRYVSLVDARVEVSITESAKNYSAEPHLYTNLVAQAIVVNSLATRLMANFLIQFHIKNTPIEMKLFNDYDKALAWLQEKLVGDKPALPVEGKI
ncbi:MAG: hypothetical protein ACHQII_07750, partial [Bacteroidia bacterium]